MLVGDNVEDPIEKVRLQSLLTRVDKATPSTLAKSVTLPSSPFFEEIAFSKTPARCSVDGNIIKRLRTGTCVVLYTIIDSSGNEFTTERKILFKKQN